MEGTYDESPIGKTGWAFLSLLHYRNKFVPDNCGIKTLPKEGQETQRNRRGNDAIDDFFACDVP